MKDPRRLPAEVIGQLQDTVKVCHLIAGQGSWPVAEENARVYAVQAEEAASSALSLHAKAWREWLEGDAEDGPLMRRDTGQSVVIEEARE